jgi:hypothetical protein
MIKKILYGLAALLAVYFLLLIPPDPYEIPDLRPAESPFIWGQDDLWHRLEQSFRAARRIDREQLMLLVDARTKAMDELLHDYEASVRDPRDPIYAELENGFFELAPLIAATSGDTDWHIGYYNRIRKKIKRDSSTWDTSLPAARDTIYRTLYGLRAAIEEIELQWGRERVNPVLSVGEEPSATPATEILGIKVHSGDLLVSRGGAEMSAFIARANDYPGNFSHVAIIYVEEETKTPHIVEAHIEKGVAIATTDAYLEDRKLRFMVLRPRSDLPQIVADPMLPHDAAKYAFNEAMKRHIPYDFAMDYFDSTAMFCSEVGAYAYRQFGISLWEPKSTVSSEGIVRWLTTFGVRNFFTLLPADLEYDPSLSVVAEWRDRETLAKDHVDNAVVDALISRANAGEELDYNPWMLPVARVLKAYSVAMNSLGKVAIVPEGMGVLTTLTNEEFKRRFRETKRRTLQMAEDFEKDRGYPPPYWELVSFAAGT